MDRRVLYGAAAVVAYLGAVLGSAKLGAPPQRPVYDGLAPPPPYRYVRPPPDLAADNETPLRAVGTLILSDDGSRARTVSTADGQMLVVFPDRAIPAREDEDEVTVRITPLDPQPLPPGPEGLTISGNAYEVEARYPGSRAAVDLREEATAVLRYPTHSSVMLRRDGTRWRRLETQSAQASLQLFANSRELGTFVAAGVPEASRAWIAYLAAGAGVLAGAAGYFTGRRRPRRRRSRPRPRRPPRRRPR